LRDQDQQFFDSFMLVIGILIGVGVGLFFLARMIAMDTQGVAIRTDPRVLAEIDSRIAPVGKVLLLGDDALAAAQATAAAAPAREAMPLTGPQVYNEVCYICHAAPGVGGAPVLGDVEQWQPRIEQGMDTLVMHAINGYQGNAGYMPAKGGRVDLSDQEVRDAIQYMVDQAEGGEQ
jgi:cytochrome c5